MKNSEYKSYDELPLFLNALLEYFINSVRFNAERKTLDIQVDGKKESLWMDELVVRIQKL